MKSFFYVLVGLLFVLGATGCSLRGQPVPFRSVKWSAEGHPLPRYPMWSLAGQDSSKADHLPDPDSLYVFHYSREQIGGRPETLLDGYYFLRFWRDGRFIHRSMLMKAMPTPADGDDFGYSHVGHYKVVGSQIEMEYYAAEDGGIYERRKGTISNPGIAQKSTVGKGHEFYQRVQFPKGSMVRKPTW